MSNAESIRLLNEEVIADMSAEQSAGPPAVPLPGPWQRWGDRVHAVIGGAALPQ